MDNTEKIKAEDLAEELKIAIKDIFVAQTRKYLDEIHMKFPNGQKFTIAVWENKEGNVEPKVSDKNDIAELSGEEYHKWFEEKLSNWIKVSIKLLFGVDAEQDNDKIFVPLPTGQEYIITIQKK